MIRTLLSDIRGRLGEVLAQLEPLIEKWNRELTQLRRTRRDVDAGIIKLDIALAEAARGVTRRGDIEQIGAWLDGRRDLPMVAAEKDRLARMTNGVGDRLLRLDVTSEKAAVKRAGLKDEDGGMDAEWYGLWDSPSSYASAPSQLDGLIRRMTAWAARFEGLEREQGREGGSYRDRRLTIAGVVRLAGTVRKLDAERAKLNNMIKTNDRMSAKTAQVVDRARAGLRRLNLDAEWRAERARVEGGLEKAGAGIAMLREIKKDMTMRVAMMDALIAERGSVAGLDGLAGELEARRGEARRLVMETRAVGRRLKGHRARYRKISLMVDVGGAPDVPPPGGGERTGKGRSNA